MIGASVSDAGAAGNLAMPSVRCPYLKQRGQFLHRLSSEFPDMGVDSFVLKVRPGPKPTPGTFTFKMTWYAAPSRVTQAE